MDQRHLQAVDVKVGAAWTGQHAGRAVVVGVDVRDEQAAQPAGAEMIERLADGVE